LGESKTLGGYGPVRLGVADPEKLKAILEAERASLGQELRDALVRSCAFPGVSYQARLSLLRSVGEVAGDPTASAFASYFTAESLTVDQASSATAGHQEAARLFAEAGLKAGVAEYRHATSQVSGPDSDNEIAHFWSPFLWLWEIRGI
jgi:hypothetical protein